jgi:hypothetical protein
MQFKFYTINHHKEITKMMIMMMMIMMVMGPTNNDIFSSLHIKKNFGFGVFSVIFLINFKL